MQALRCVRLRRWLAGAATVIVALAACGDDAELGVGGGEDHGYDAFMATLDALAIGRKTVACS
jgi:hypothetical protein